MKNLCKSENIKLKSNFLRPKSENAKWLEENINKIFSNWCQWRRDRFPEDSVSISNDDLNNLELKKFQEKINVFQEELSKRFESEVPKYSPRYMGHMVSEISLPALFGHLVGLLHNPNNSSLIAARVGIDIESEAIKELCDMIGFKIGTGHFTSGGTVANIEGLWRARYNLDSRLALSSFLVSKEKLKENLFKAAHTSFEKLKLLFEVSSFDENEARKYSFVEQGMLIAAKKFKELYNEEFLGPIVLVPSHKHYSWQKAISLMGLAKEALWGVQIDESGHLCLKDLTEKIERAKKEGRPILAVVSVTGTTELGMIDAVHKVQDLLEEYKSKGIYIWHHVDGAYGGVYTSMLRGSGELEFDFKGEVKLALDSLKRVDSITLDPHKLAMVPYACGAILVKDSFHYHVSQFDAPYLIESKKNSGKWNSTLEGSRAATGACATWMLAKSLGFNKDGMGKLLSFGIGARRKLEQVLKEEHEHIKIIEKSDSNILCFTFVLAGEKSSFINKRALAIYNKIVKEDEFSVSKTTLTKDSYGDFYEKLVRDWEIENDDNQLTLIRMVLMNPFALSQKGGDYLALYSQYLKKLKKSFL